MLSPNAQSGSGRYKDAIWKRTVQRRNLEDYGTKDRNLEDYGTKDHNLEADGTKTQSGRLRYKDACAMMHTFDWQKSVFRQISDKNFTHPLL